MKKHDWKSLVVAAALLLPLAGAAAAQGDPSGNTEERLEAARERLEQAAREIAELTSGAVGEALVMVRSQLDETRRPRPVVLGINIGPAGAPGSREDGVRVVGVTPDSAADAAGIRSGDVLLSINGQKLDWSGDSAPARKLLDALSVVDPGSRLLIDHRRGDRVLTADVEAKPRPQRFDFDFSEWRDLPPRGRVYPGGRFLADRWGDMELVELTPGLGEYFKTPEGVLVVRAPSDSTLDLRDGDVILDIGGRKPLNPRHVVRILRSYAPGERLVMTVVRQEKKQTLEADIPD